MSASLIHNFSVALTSHDGTTFLADAVCTVVNGDVEIDSLTFAGEPVDASEEEREIVKTLCISTL